MAPIATIAAPPQPIRRLLATLAARRRSLRLDDLDAAVLLPVLIAVVRNHRLLAAEADGGDAAAVDPLRDEVVAAGLRALQRERLVLLRVPDVVGVSGDLDFGAPAALLQLDEQ